MNKKVTLIITIFGSFLIILGIILTIVPLFHFDSETFKLSSALLSGIGFPFVGIVLIIISTILGINDKNDTSPDEKTKEIDVSITTDNSVAKNDTEENKN